MQVPLHTPSRLTRHSGTTGLPKAFPLTVARNYGSASLFPKTFGQQPGPGADRTYYCIPLYHGTGGIAAMNDLMGGISIAIAPKFSLRQFWTDCIASGSTIFVYGKSMVSCRCHVVLNCNSRRAGAVLVVCAGLAKRPSTPHPARLGKWSQS
jgi:acyl-CoA synthetase (AMP-forming)/AMP-acid ligase II